MKKVFLILFFIAGITNSCVKYEEGPCMSKHSVQGKFYGHFNIINYTVDGVDSLAQFMEHLGTSVEVYYNEVYSYDVLRIVGYPASDSVLISLDSRWELVDNYKIFNIYEAYGDNGTGPFGAYKKTSWTILKLNDEGFKMETNYCNKMYLISIGNKH